MRAPFWIAALLLAAWPGAGAPAAETGPPTLTLTGQGSVAVTPDIATVQIGVETNADTARAALAGNSEAAAKIIDALKGAGLEPRDIQTSGFSVSPIYADRKSFSDGEPVVRGYRVTNMVTARVRALERLGAVLDQVVDVGANRIHGISFGLDDDTEALDRARIAAVEDATRKARIYAEATGVSLARILSISEAGAVVQPRGAVMMEMARAAVPVEVGETTIGASVTITWEITQTAD